MPKEVGGLGFFNMNDLNVALVSKLAWHFLKNEDCLLVHLLKNKNLRGMSGWQAERGVNSSWIWSSIVRTMPLLRDGACYLVGDAQSLNVW